MSLTIDLTPELENRLRDEAAQRGMNPEQYARRLLESRLAGNETSVQITAAREEWLLKFNAWMDSHDPDLPPFADGDLVRADFYGARG